MASKTSTRERRRGRGGKGERLSSEFSLGVFWQIYVFYDGGNFEVNNGEDGGRRGGGGAIDGDRWRFELEDEITSLSLPLSFLPSPFRSFNFGSYCHARSSSRDFRPAGATRRAQFAGFGAATLYDTLFRAEEF